MLLFFDLDVRERVCVFIMYVLFLVAFVLYTYLRAEVLEVALVGVLDGRFDLLQNLNRYTSVYILTRVNKPYYECYGKCLHIHSPKQKQKKTKRCKKKHVKVMWWQK